jgi:hypothetical protein
MSIRLISLAMILTALPLQAENTIEYASYETAMTELKVNPEAQVDVTDGWTKISIPSKREIWWFSPVSYPAHPALAKIEILFRDGDLRMDANILCRAGKQECDMFAGKISTFVANSTQEFKR